MPRKTNQKKDFKGMRYGEVQRINSENRRQLKPEEQQWLKEHGYKNVGWAGVIALFQKIEELLDNQSGFEDMSLEDLFLEADRIGNKYQTPEEIQQFDQQLAREVAAISDLVDQQFPDTEIETIDFSSKTAKHPAKTRHQKTYRTAKLS